MTDTEITMSDNHTVSIIDAEIDLYADVVENELDPDMADQYGMHSDHHKQMSQDADLYDDVITTQNIDGDFADVTSNINPNNAKVDQTRVLHFEEALSNRAYNGKRVSLYVGQLTWWTTDTDLADGIREIGINDLLDIKFHENRVNGQSKGFAVVTVGSEVSSRAIFEKMSKREIHGQAPMVLPFNKNSLNFLEGTTHKDEPMPQMNVPPIRPIMHPPMSLPISIQRGNSMTPSFHFPPHRPVMLPGGPVGLGRPHMPLGIDQRSHMPGGPMILGRMPGPPNSVGTHPQQPVIVVQQPQRPGLPAGLSIPSGSLGVLPGQHPSVYYPAQAVQNVVAPQSNVPMSLNQAHPDPYFRGVENPTNMMSISEAEYQSILECNRSVTSSAIARAVKDAATGDYAQAIETLVTAISLIRQSKIGQDKQCKIFVNTLQDTQKGIETNLYGQKSRSSRSRSRSPHEARRKRHHRTRSPRDRSEYRRSSEDYDIKYSRDHRRR